VADTMFKAAIVVVSVHDMHASRLKALDNAPRSGNITATPAGRSKLK